MKELKLDDIVIKRSIPVKEAMKILDSKASSILFVVNENNKFMGTITDGDIRRYILINQSLDNTVDNACNRNCYVSIQNKYDINEVYIEMHKKAINHTPVLSDDGYLIDIISSPSSQKRIKKDHEKLNIPVVIMAGGKGTRMAPFTQVLPKPLIPIGDKTILEIIMDEFSPYGISSYYFTLNYRGEMIKAYFDGLEKKYEVKYVWEKEFNGTASSLGLIDDIHSDFIVSNCDIIVKADISDVYKFHKDNNALVTVISSMQHQQIPYGVIDFKSGGEVTGLREKPEFTFPINTGVYILSPECFEYIPKDEFFHMTHLIELLIEKKKKVVTYPVNQNRFIDIGQWSEYKGAIEMLSLK